MHTTRINPFNCLACGYAMDSATVVTSKRRPKPGDVSLCVRCANVAAFRDDLQLRPLTELEKVSVLSDPLIITAVQAIRESLGFSQ